MRPEDDEIADALVRSNIALVVLRSMLKHAGISGYDIAEAQIKENQRIINLYGFPTTPEEFFKQIELRQQYKNSGVKP